MDLELLAELTLCRFLVHEFILVQLILYGTFHKRNINNSPCLELQQLKAELVSAVSSEKNNDVKNVFDEFLSCAEKVFRLQTGAPRRI